MQDKKHGGSEQGEESTAGGVSAVRKGIVLAFLLMTCAVALPNTVTNDVVVATSDAELRISDRGLGLGLEVVGGTCCRRVSSLASRALVDDAGILRRPLDGALPAL